MEERIPVEKAMGDFMAERSIPLDSDGFSFFEHGKVGKGMWRNSILREQILAHGWQ